MTQLYFVRHAQPIHTWEEDRTRPLTEEGKDDSKKVSEILKNIPFSYAISSPYLRSVDTISDFIQERGLKLHTDERLRERRKGPDGNVLGMFQRRWGDLDYHEDQGESLRMVQRRNMEVIFELLDQHRNENIIIGTHGTALSTILHYYNPAFGCKDFLRIIDYMPYIIRLDFKDSDYIGQEELLIIEKEFQGKHRADKQITFNNSN